MKKSDIYEVTIKILGLYLFYNAIGLLSDFFTIFAAMRQSDSAVPSVSFDVTPFLILNLVYLLVVILLALFLTFKTKTIVKFVCKPTDYDETVTLFADRNVVYEIALVIMGLLLIVWTLPDFAFRLKNHFQLVQSSFTIESSNSNYIFGSAIKIGVGLIAVIYAKSISTFLSK